MSKTDPKFGLGCCCAIFGFNCITLYYGGLSALESSFMNLTAIALATMYWKEIQKGKVK
jgi:hypothetical protein